MIATVESVGERSIEEVAPGMAMQSGIEGLFILISKKERKIQVLVSHRLLGETMKRRRDVIRMAFIDGFRHGDFDEGLKLGLDAIDESLLLAHRAGELPGQPGLAPTATSRKAANSGSPLVLRNQVRLTLSGARVLIAAAQDKANSLKLKVNIAVVDDGGHLIAFERMDGARPASGYTAITKATSAATFRQSSGPIPAGAPLPDPLLNLSLQMAASASGGRITSLYGGVPVVVDGQVIGAIGVGGGTGEQDTQVATAGVTALIREDRRRDATASKVMPGSLRINLGTFPPARFVAAIDPPVLRVTIDLEKVDFVRIEHEQAEMSGRGFRVGMGRRKRLRPFARLPGSGQVKLTRTASANSRQELLLASRSAASSLSCRTTTTAPLIRYCSWVTGKYQQTCDEGERSRSTTFSLRASVTKVNRGLSFRKPRKTTVRLAGRPSLRTVASCKNRE